MFSGANPLFGMLNVSLGALIMLITFLLMDEEAIKFLRRKTNNFLKMETFGNFDAHQSESKSNPRIQKETHANGIYVIDLEV